MQLSFLTHGLYDGTLKVRFDQVCMEISVIVIMTLGNSPKCGAIILRFSANPPPTHTLFHCRLRSNPEYFCTSTTVAPQRTLVENFTGDLCQKVWNFERNALLKRTGSSYCSIMSTNISPNPPSLTQLSFMTSGHLSYHLKNVLCCHCKYVFI